MKLKLNRGTTSKIIRVPIGDTTKTSTDGGLTGLVYNSSGLICYYIREGDTAATAVTLATTTVGAYVSGGFVEVDSTHMPGLYELGLPAAALANGNSVVVYLIGATNQFPVRIEIELDAVNYQSNTAFVASATVGGYASGQDPATLTWNASRSTFKTTGSFGAILQGVRDGMAQGGSSTTITLDSGASAATNFYANQLVEIVAGTGVGQSLFVKTYNGSTKVASMYGSWGVTPDATSQFCIQFFDNIPGGVPATAAQVATATAAAILAVPGVPLANSATGQVGIDLTNIKQAATSTTLANITVPSVSNTATVGGLAPPANWSALGITPAGKLGGVALVDTVTTYTGNTPQSGDLYAVVNPMVVGHVFTTSSLANMTSSAGGSFPSQAPANWLTSSAFAAGVLPPYFASLGITSAGKISEVVLTDTATAVTNPVSTGSPAAGLAVVGSTNTSVTLSGLPAGKTYAVTGGTTNQRLLHGPSGEARVIATQTVSGGNYIFTFGTGSVEAGPFSANPTTGDLFYLLP